MQFYDSWNAICLFLVSLVIIPSLFTLVLWYKKHPESNFISPLKVMAILLGLFLFIKWIYVIICLKNENFYSSLPFHFSDFCIFSLLLFCFSVKKNLKRGLSIEKTSFSFNDLMYYVWILESFTESVTLLAAPKVIYSLPIDSVNDFKRWFGFFSHYSILVCCIWTLIFRPIKLEFKKTLFPALFIAISTLAVIGATYTIHCNFNFAGSIKFENDYLALNNDWTNPWWSLLWFIIVIGIFSASFLILYYTDRFYLKVKEKVKLN